MHVSCSTTRIFGPFASGKQVPPAQLAGWANIATGCVMPSAGLPPLQAPLPPSLPTASLPAFPPLRARASRVVRYVVARFPPRKTWAFWRISRAVDLPNRELRGLRGLPHARRPAPRRETPAVRATRTRARTGSRREASAPPKRFSTPPLRVALHTRLIFARAPSRPISGAKANVRRALRASLSSTSDAEERSFLIPHRPLVLCRSRPAPRPAGRTLLACRTPAVLGSRAPWVLSSGLARSFSRPPPAFVARQGVRRPLDTAATPS